MRSKKINFKIERCNPKIKKCANESDIDEFMKGLLVENWVYNEMIDYDRFEGRPIYHIMDMKTQWFLDPYES